MLRIFSFLPFEDLVRTTSTLSKRWQNAWFTEFPTLEFPLEFFEADDGTTAERREYLMNFVERVLSIRLMFLEKLVLYVPWQNPKNATFLDRCVSSALRCNVKYLDLSYRMRTVDALVCDLPRSVFAAESISTLRLHGFKLETSSLSTNNMNMPSLKVLSLCRCIVDRQIINNLIANCPVIEELRLSFSLKSEGTLKISGVVNPKLVRVEIFCWNFESLEIEAPNLQSFSLKSELIPRHCPINLSSCKNVRWLDLCSCDVITDKWIDDHVPNFYFLEKLILRCCNMLESIKISSRRLEELVVRNCYKLVNVDIDDPHLSKFVYSGQRVISFSSNALALSEVDIDLYPNNVENHFKFIQFLKKFSHAKVVTLRGQLRKVFAIYLLHDLI